MSDSTEIIKYEKLTEEQREFLYNLKGICRTHHEITTKFNEAWVGDPVEGKRSKPLDRSAVTKFYRSRIAAEELPRYIDKMAYKLRELPFATAHARIQKYGEMVLDPAVGNRERRECLREIFNEMKYQDELMRSNRPEPIIVLKMQAFDEDDPLLDTEYFTKTDQMMLKLLDEYGDKNTATLKKLIKEYRAMGGSLPYDNDPGVRTINVEAEAVTDEQEQAIR